MGNGLNTRPWTTWALNPKQGSVFACIHVTNLDISFLLQCFDYPNYMRLVLTVPAEQLREACQRITAFCQRHHRSEDTDVDTRASNCSALIFSKEDGIRPWTYHCTCPHLMWSSYAYSTGRRDWPHFVVEPVSNRPRSSRVWTQI